MRIYIYNNIHTYSLRGVSTTPLRFSQIRMCPFCMVRFCIHLHIELVASFLLNANLRNRYPCLDCLLIASRQNCSLLQLRLLGKMMLRYETSLSKVTNFKIEWHQRLQRLSLSFIDMLTTHESQALVDFSHPNRQPGTILKVSSFLMVHQKPHETT